MLHLSSGKFRVGVDLGSTNIKAAGIRQKGQVFQLKFYEVIDLIKEYSLTSMNQITDDLYIEQLRNLVSQYPLKNAKVHVTLPANLTVIHNLKLDPSQTELQITEFIEEELRQVTFGQIDEMRIACQQIEENNVRENQITLLACAVPNSVAERYLRIFCDGGLKVSVMDLDAISVYNAFYFFQRKTITAPVTIVQIGSQYTICLIMLPGKCPFFYIIKLGGNYITNRIKEEFCLTFFKAEKLKIRFFQPKWASLDAFQSSKLHQIFFEFANNLVSEVKRCMRHFQSYECVAEIGKIYLTGGGAKLGLISNFFFEHLHIETKIWNPLNFFIKKSPKQNEHIRQHLGIHLTPTLGTLLRGD